MGRRGLTTGSGIAGSEIVGPTNRSLCSQSRREDRNPRRGVEEEIKSSLPYLEMPNILFRNMKVAA